jgi:predicted RNase H-like HicB family nuclease
MRRYTVLLDPNPEYGDYTVTVPSLPGVVTQGGNLEESF